MRYSTKIGIFVVFFIISFQILMTFIITPEMKDFLITQILIGALSTSALAVVLGWWGYRKTEEEVEDLRTNLLNQIGLSNEDIIALQRVMPQIAKILEKIDDEKLERIEKIVNSYGNKWEDEEWDEDE